MSWKLFPITPGAKTPALAGDWRKHATSDPAQVESWRAAGYDLAVDCGGSGLFVIDIDGEIGEQSFKALELEHGALPPTYTVRTPRGRHLYYAGSGPSSVGTGLRGLGPKIDTRGAGGYVVWEGPGRELNEAAPAVVASLPAWVLPALNQRVDHKPAATSDQDTPWQLRQARAYIQGLAPVVQGQGADATTYQLAATLKDLGVSEDKAVELMLEFYDCQPQDERYEAFIERKVNNAYHYGQNEAGAKAVAGDPRTRFAGARPVQAEPTRSRYHLWSVTEALSRPRPSFLLPGILPARSTGVFYGPKNIGKTWLVLDQALHLATGKAGYGRDPSEPQDVIYFIGEGFEDLVHSRVHAWCADHEYVSTLPHFHLLENFPDVSNDADVNVLGQEIRQRELNPCLIILDTYSRVLAQAGLNENDPVDVMKFVRQAEDLKRGFTCTIAAIHHTGKDIEKGPRGAQTLLDALDFGWEVTGDVELALMARCEKMRASRKAPNMYFEPRAVEGALVLEGITESAYRALTYVQDMYHPSSIGTALAKLGASSEEHAVTAYVLARALHHPTIGEPELETNATIDRIARKLATLGKGRLEQYCHGQKWWVPEDG